VTSAVSCALNTLKVIQSNDTPTELGEKYQAFFDRFAERLYLSADQARHAIVSLGLASKHDGDRS